MTLKPKFKICSGNIRVHRPRRNSRCSHQQARCCSLSFWDAQVVVMVDYLQRGSTIIGLYYAVLIRKLRDAIKEKSCGKLRRKVLLHQDKAPSHKSLAAMAAISTAGFELLDHPPYHQIWPPATTGYSQNWRSTCVGRNFHPIMRQCCPFAKVGQPFFQEAVEMLEHRWEKCVRLLGDCVVK